VEIKDEIEGIKYLLFGIAVILFGIAIGDVLKYICGFGGLIFSIIGLFKGASKL